MTHEDLDSDARRKVAHLANLPHHPETDADTDAGSDRASTSRSRWVYVLWIAGIALVLLVVGLHLTGTIGPGSH